MSPFCVLFGSGCNQSLITATGFDHESFRLLLELFLPVYENYSPYSSDGRIVRLRKLTSIGRPRSMTATMSLGLHLVWMRSRGSEWLLCMIFGIKSSVCSLFLRFSRRILIHLLCNNAHVAANMPSDEEVHQFENIFAMRNPSLHNTYRIADGLKLALQ